VIVVTRRAGRLAVRWVLPSGAGKQEAWKAMGAWRRKAGAPGGSDEWRPTAWWSPPSGDGAVMMLQARGAWQCVMPVRRSEPSVCLATWDAHQAILVR